MVTDYGSFEWPPAGGGGGGTGNIASINGQVGPAISILPGTGIGIVTNSNTITISATDLDASEVLEYHTITGGEAAAKQFTLSATPLTANKTMVDIITGGPQNFGTDFTITVNVFDWNGLGLDGILTTGDIVRCHYLS